MYTLPITLTHKIRLQPNRAQSIHFAKACGISRFVWNWALSEWKRKVELGERPNALELKKQFNAIKPIQFPWVYEVTKYASQQPFLHLRTAFQRFFDKKARYPRFKKKGVHDSFYVGCDHIKVKGDRIWIPKLGWIRMRETLRFSGKINSATISRAADQWYVALSVTLDVAPKLCESQESIGVDLGIHCLATLSNGEEFVGPKPLKRHLRKLRRLSRQLSRKKLRSKNRQKAKIRLAKLQLRIRNTRHDALHKLTTYLSRNYEVIGIEDLNVKGMMKNRRLSRAIQDMGFHEFERQLAYKSLLRGSHVVEVGRWFPSSKMCSRCDVVKDNLPLGERLFRCDVCNLEIGRDKNAAINIVRNVCGLIGTVSSTGYQACGEESSGLHLDVGETSLDEAGTGT
jgi:putative transposase